MLPITALDQNTLVFLLQKHFFLLNSPFFEQCMLYLPILYFLESLVDLVVISRAFHLYDLGSSLRLCMEADICLSQSDSVGFSLGTPVFLPLQILLLYQDLNRRAVKR